MLLCSRLTAAAIIGAFASACSTSPSTQPTTPTDPIVNCPADLSVTGHGGQPPTVSFNTPAPANGTPPVRVSCVPGSGTQFPNGVTTVTCEATDARARRASCSFLVTVTPVPQLQKTTFLAFGDSITEGKIALRVQTGIVVPPNISNFGASYVERLYPKLAGRYPDQTITLVAYGLGGELAVEGTRRLRDNWPTFHPDALLLLEGTNDLTAGFGTNASIDGLVGALRADVQFAKSQGARVFLGTLVPITPPQSATIVSSVATANARIRSLAAAESVTLVNLNAVVPDIYIGPQGLHPTAQGYEAMADEWLNAIVSTMEIRTSTTP
jgi:lysophospholipase L1-like esterase